MSSCLVKLEVGGASFWLPLSFCPSRPLSHLISPPWSGGALHFSVKAVTGPLAPIPPCEQSLQWWGSGAEGPSPSPGPHDPPHEQRLMVVAWCPPCIPRLLVCLTLPCLALPQLLLLLIVPPTVHPMSNCLRGWWCMVHRTLVAACVHRPHPPPPLKHPMSRCS